MITEQDVKTSITKHYIKAMFIAALLTIVMQAINGYFFDDSALSPFLIIIISISGCLYVFRNVMLDLFVSAKETDKPS